MTKGERWLFTICSPFGIYFVFCLFPELGSYPAEHLLFLFPEKRELAQQKTVQQQQALVSRENEENVGNGFEPHRRRVVVSEQVKEPFPEPHHRRTRQTENCEYQ